MPVGIPEIQKKRIGKPVTARATLHTRQPTGRRQYVAHMDDVSDGAHPHPDVMETRSAPVGERDVVNAAFAMQPYRPDLIAAVDGRVLRRAEPDFSEEVVRRLHVRRK